MTICSPAKKHETTLDAFLDLQYNTNKAQTLLRAAINNPLFTRKSDDDLSDVDNLLQISIDYISRIEGDGENCEAGFMRLLTEKQAGAAQPAEDGAIVRLRTQPDSSLPIELIMDLLACASDPSADEKWLKKAAALGDRIVRATRMTEKGEPIMMSWMRLIHARGLEGYLANGDDGIVRFVLSPTPEGSRARRG